eukprot:2956848-Ditylum_brightwellii.AAC.1
MITVDTDQGALKVCTDPLPKFSGNLIDFEDWERKAGATIQQTAYKRYLSCSATAGDIVEEAHSGELYNMILSCVGDGSALNIIEKAKNDNSDIKCGYQAWSRLKEWFL